MEQSIKLSLQKKFDDMQYGRSKNITDEEALAREEEYHYEMDRLEAHERDMERYEQERAASLQQSTDRDIKSLGITEFDVIVISFTGELHIVFEHEEDLNFYRLSRLIDRHITVLSKKEFLELNKLTQIDIEGLPMQEWHQMSGIS